MRHANLAIISLLFASLASADPVAREPCPRLLMRAYAAIQWPTRKLNDLYSRALLQRSWNRIDWNGYERFLEKFRADASLKPKGKSFEENAAFLLAALERLPGSDASGILSDALKSEKWTKRLAAYRLLHGSSRNPIEMAREILSLRFRFQSRRVFADGISGEGVHRLMREVYALNRVPTSGILYPWEWGEARSARLAEAALQKYVDFRIDRDGMERYLRDMDILGDPKLADAVTSFLESKTGKSLISAATQTYALRGFIGTFPRFEFFDLEPDLVFRAWKGDKAKLLADLSATSGRSLKTTMKVNGAFEIATFVGSIVTGVTVWNQFRDERRKKEEAAIEAADRITRNLEAVSSELERELEIAKRLTPKERLAWRTSIEFREAHPGEASPADSTMLQNEVSKYLAKEPDSAVARRRVDQAVEQYFSVPSSHSSALPD